MIFYGVINKMAFPSPMVAVRFLSVSRQSLLGGSQLLAAVARGSKQSAADKKKAEEAKKKLKKLHSKLSKEKSALLQLKKKYAEESKKERQKIKQLETKEKQKLLDAKKKAKQQESIAKKKEQELIKKATKPFRRLSAYNLFIKEHLGDGGLADAASSWNALLSEEKNGYQQKADAFNAKALEIVTPKPKAPPSSYAKFVKEMYVNDGREFKDINKDLAAKWKAMSNDEKSKYEPSNAQRDEYKAKLKAWTDLRIKAFREHKDLF